MLDYTAVELDLELLVRNRHRLAIEAGAASGEQFPARAARGLAERLGVAPVAFPGDHDGYLSGPAPFAAALLSVLR